MIVTKDKTSNSVQACPDLAHVVLVLVGVRRVTVVIVHNGLEGILVVIQFCVAILFVNCCIKRCSLYKQCGQDSLGKTFLESTVIDW